MPGLRSYAYMKKFRGNRFLIWALALSAALHLVVAVAIHNLRPVEAAPEQQPLPIKISTIVTPPPPTPQPTPPPQRPHHALQTPARAHHQTHVAHVAPPHADSTTTGGATEPQVAATGGGTGDDIPGTPTPTDSPKPSCSNPNVAAHTLEAVNAETPEDITGLPATVQVQVTLDENGRVKDARVYASAGNSRLDRAALVAARTSTYAPAIVDCLPTGGTYLFRVDFQD